MSGSGHRDGGLHERDEELGRIDELLDRAAAGGGVSIPQPSGAPRPSAGEAIDEPPASRRRGPAAFHVTKVWLHEAWADLRWEIHDVVAEGDLVVVHCTMSGRHVRDFVAFRPDGEVADAFPPTGRTFATTQTHWLRVADGLVTEHWANRDDLGTAAQLGWVPPSPAYLLRMALAKRRARRRYRREA